MIVAMFAQATPPSSQTTAPTPPSTPDLLPAAPPEPALDKIGKWIDGFYFLLPNLAVAAAVLALIFLLGVMAKWGVVAWGRHRGRDNLGEVLGGFVKWTVVGVGILVAMTIAFPSVRPVDLLAGLGVGSVAVGFAFKDILQNWLAGLLLLVRQPFQVGDEVVIMGFEGTVERIERRSTDLMTYDGRRVLIPNSDVYSSAVVINTALPKRRSEYDLGIGYGDDNAMPARWCSRRCPNSMAWKPSPRRPYCRGALIRRRSRSKFGGGRGPPRSTWCRRAPASSPPSSARSTPLESTCRSRRWCSSGMTRPRRPTACAAGSAKAGPGVRMRRRRARHGWSSGLINETGAIILR